MYLVPTDLQLADVYKKVIRVAGRMICLQARTGHQIFMITNSVVDFVYSI